MVYQVVAVMYQVVAVMYQVVAVVYLVGRVAQVGCIVCCRNLRSFQTLAARIMRRLAALVVL